MSLVLIFGAVVGGTVAWLSSQTDPVVNTFTASNIEIELKETTGTEYKMIPGYTIAKNPTVTVKADSEKCYVFIQINKSAGFDDYMVYEMVDTWTNLSGESNVFYAVFDKSDSDQSLNIIKNNILTVKGSVTKAMMANVTTPHSFTVTAYAAQFYKNNTESFSASDAWAQVLDN